jgi:polysaccharide chain length determinant protein (PEP-CTERM system associated)
MNTQQSQVDTLMNYLNLFIFRYKIILLSLLLAVTAAYPFYLNIPKIYQSSASIIFKEQQVNPSRLSPDEGMQLREMVNTVTQQVLSRTNLEKIIKDFDLYAEMRQIVPIDDIIEKMRIDDIKVDMGREMGNVFSVSFKGKDPQTVVRVTNELAAKFIEENLRVRGERAQETAKYIKDELRMSKETLQDKESQIRDYKLKFYNEMPDQRASNMDRLTALQEQFQAIQSNIHDREQTRMLVLEQLEVRKNSHSASTGPASQEGGAGGGSGLWNDLETARNTRQELLSRYTTEHPNVKRIEKQIRQLEAQLENINKTGAVDAAAGTAASYSRIEELALQLKEIDLDLKIQREESANMLHQIKLYQKWIEAAPVHEAKWSALTRDYDELKRYHDALLAQSLAADATENLERHQKGSQFKIIDPAYLPITPIKGTFRIVFLAAAMIGLALGMGFILCLDLMDTSFKDKTEIEDFIKIPVTCAVPLLITEAEKKRIRTKEILWNCFFAAWLIVLVGVTFYLRYKGLLIL